MAKQFKVTVWTKGRHVISGDFVSDGHVAINRDFLSPVDLAKIAERGGEPQEVQADTVDQHAAAATSPATVSAVRIDGGRERGKSLVAAFRPYILRSQSPS